MKKILTFLSFILVSSWTSAQVGIGTTNPNASLDVRSSDQAAPSNSDGILIPKIDDFPASDPTAAQDGMLVYVTGNGTPNQGFYYWDNTNTTWVAVFGYDDHDFYGEGTTSAPTDINDDKFTFGNLAIGKNTADYQFEINDTTSLASRVINVQSINETSSKSSVYHSEVNYIGTDTIQGIYQNISGSGSGLIMGSHNEFTNSGGGNQMGFYNTFSGANGQGYGFYNNFVDTGLYNEYGTYNYFGSSNFAKYGLYNDFPFNVTGSGIQTGVFNNMIGGSGNRYGVQNFIQNQEYSSFGFYNSFSIFPPSLFDNKEAIGLYNTFGGIAGGYLIGVENIIVSNSGNGQHWGIYNILGGSGTGNKYGSYNNISSSAGGTHYGVYSDVQKSGSYAGYFVGDVFVSGTFSNPSSKIFKENITTKKNVLDNLLKLNVVDYSFKRYAFPQLGLPSGTRTGFIAEEMEMVFPDLVKEVKQPATFEETEEKLEMTHPEMTFKSIDYISLIPLLLKGIQEQEQHIETLQQQLKIQKKEIDEIKSQLKKQ